MYLYTLAAIVALLIYGAILGWEYTWYIWSFVHSENISALRKSAKRRRQSGNPCWKFCGRIGSDAK